VRWDKKTQMEKGITVYDFLKTKEITPQDLKDNFKFVKRIDIDMINHKGCPNCNNKSNFYDYPSPSWTYVNQCIACNTIMVTYITDRMGGGNTDTVDVYEQKNRPMYELYFKCDIQKDCIECRHCGEVSSDVDDIKNLFCKKCNMKLE